MKWKIVCDSSCDLHDDNSESEISFATVPFTMQIGDVNYIDDKNIDIEQMVTAMEESNKASNSACPAPGAWLEHYMEADYTIAITISSSLSGSYNSAMVAKNMALEEDASKKIYVLDSKSAGPELAIIVKKAIEKIKNGCTFEEIIAFVQETANNTHVLFALSSFGNLVKNGRMNKIIGFVAGKLKMRIIGEGNDEGKISMKHKTRGDIKVLLLLIDDMIGRGFKGGMVVISYCLNRLFADSLCQMIKEKWENTIVHIIKTRGLCSYYAERGGLIVGF